jgi:hypothetical protein
MNCSVGRIWREWDSTGKTVVVLMLHLQWQGDVVTVTEFGFVTGSIEVEVNLQPTVSRPVCHGVRLPFGARDQIFVFCLTVAAILLWGALSNERMGSLISCTIASRPCQSSHSWVQAPQNSDHILLSHLRLPQPGGPGPCIYIHQKQCNQVILPGTGFHFRRLWTTCRAKAEVFYPASTRVDQWNIYRL